MASDRDVSEKLTLIARFNSVGQLQAARSALDAAGIESFTADENLVSMDWMLAQAVGSIKLAVRDEDASSAVEILTGDGHHRDTEDTEEVSREASVSSASLWSSSPLCPACGSPDIERFPRLRYFSIGAALCLGAGFAAGQPVFGWIGALSTAVAVAISKSHRCRQCEERFTLDESEVDDAPPPDGADLVEDRCPRCGSIEVHRIDYKKLKVFPLLIHMSIFVLFPLWLMLPKRQCDTCGMRVR